MNQLATITRAPAGNAVVAQLIDMDQLERRADELTRTFDQIWKLTPGNVVEVDDDVDLRESVEYYRAGACEEALALLAEIDVNEQHLNPVMLRVGDGLEPAEDKTIRQQIAFLLGSFPASTAPDPQIYSRAMIAEVSAVQPSMHALDTACRKLRRTLKWPPTIAQVLDALKEAEASWADKYSKVRSLPKQHADAIAKLTDERDRLAKLEDEERVRLQTEIDQLEVEFAAALEVESDPDLPLDAGGESIRRNIERLRAQLAKVGR